MKAKSLKEMIPNTKLTTSEIAFAAQFNLTGDHLQESHRRITADGRFKSIPVRRVIWARHPTISIIE